MDQAHLREKLTEKTNPIPLKKSTKETLIEIASELDRPHCWILRKLAERMEREWNEGKRSEKELF